LSSVRQSSLAPVQLALRFDEVLVACPARQRYHAIVSANRTLGQIRLIGHTISPHKFFCKDEPARADLVAGIAD